MNSSQLDQILRHTLEDHRLSRGERRVLKSTLAELDLDPRQLAVLRSRAFEIARQEAADPQSADVIEWLEEVVKVMQPPGPEPPHTSEAHFSPGDNCPMKIAGLLGRSRRKIDICVFTITDDRIADAIVAAEQRGVAVRIITDNDKANDRGSDVDRLKRLGIPVRFDRTEYHMHHKFALFDESKLLTGSYNWTRGAAQYNMENFIVTSEPGLVSEFSATFERLWEKLG